MKKHLWLVAVSAILMVGVTAYAIATRLVTQTTQSITVTGSNATALTRKVDTIAILSDMGKYKQGHFAATVQLTDSAGEASSSTVADSARFIFYGVNKGIYTIIDTLNITPLCADSARNGQKTIEWYDSLGVSRLRGYSLVMVRILVDTANKAATLGSDSAFNYNVSWNFYATE